LHGRVYGDILKYCPLSGFIASSVVGRTVVFLERVLGAGPYLQAWALYLQLLRLKSEV
jgi:hypothetical protein